MSSSVTSTCTALPWPPPEAAVGHPVAGGDPLVLMLSLAEPAYLKRKSAVCSMPSAKRRISLRHWPAQAGLVFQT